MTLPPMARPLARRHLDLQLRCLREFQPAARLLPGLRRAWDQRTALRSGMPPGGS
jgi:hypothetical protein